LEKLEERILLDGVTHTVDSDLDEEISEALDGVGDLFGKLQQEDGDDDYEDMSSKFHRSFPVMEPNAISGVENIVDLVDGESIIRQLADDVDAQNWGADHYTSDIEDFFNNWSAPLATWTCGSASTR
jgi:hypothetical protein